MGSATQAKEAALKLGSLLRSVKVQRGLGTIRQDVNISIPGGARVEIKGFQDIDGIEKLIELEVERQESLLVIRDELKKTGANAGKIIDSTEIFRKTKNKKISSMINEGKLIWAMKLDGLSGLLKRRISGDRTLGRELSGYAKAYGSGIMHSDEDVKKYEIESEFGVLLSELGASHGDLIVIAIGERKAMEAVAERAKKLLEGVLEETREANEDYTTSYSRPLPGKSRLYPETDIPPAKPFDVPLPETLDQRKSRYMKTGLNEQLCEELFRSPFSHLFEDFSKNPVRTATLLTATLKELKRDRKKTENISEENLRELLAAMEESDIPKEKVYEIIIGFTEGRKMPKVDTLGADEVRAAIEEEIMKNKALVERDGEQAFQKLMGPVMAKLRGRVSGAVISEELKKRLKR
ncbi:MAG: Glu-tRNA(Gln) amidotransferase subunit GatE [Candidatus Aenigmarchaeota archaeon]|nr:Glu-tRNA(Gln) amidotransferase subunit GatE [Candidatus Aenigmarchaeota archaeon]